MWPLIQQKRGGPKKFPITEETESTADAENDEEVKEDPRRKSEEEEADP